MYFDYNMEKGLAFCDSLGTFISSDGCWQGLFMENMNGALAGDWERTGFTYEDPLNPCNQLDEKYQHECYINHSAWVMRVFKNDVAQSVEACLKAATRNTQVSCIESITLRVSNPGNQIQFLS